MEEERVEGRTGERVRVPGVYECEDGCAQVEYEAGDVFAPCAACGGLTVWIRVR